MNGINENDRIKVIVTDLDGTLTDSNKHVLPYTRVAVHEAIRQGCKLVLASGRPQFGIRKVIEELDLKEYGGYILSYNGALITEIKTDKIIFEQKLPEELLLEIYEFISDIPHVHIATYQPGYIYSETQGDQYIAIEGFGCSTKITVVKYLPDIIKDGVFKYVVTGEPEQILEVRKAVDKEFAGKISTIISEPFFLEIVPKGINKAASLKRLMDYMGYNGSNIAAFGDGRNDIEMLQYAGLSFAMGNGCKEVKDVANLVIDTNDYDGVGKAIKKYILNKD